MSCATFSKDLSPIFMLWFCPAFWWHQKSVGSENCQIQELGQFGPTNDKYQGPGPCLQDNLTLFIGKKTLTVRRHCHGVDLSIILVSLISTTCSLVLQCHSVWAALAMVVVFNGRTKIILRYRTIKSIPSTVNKGLLLVTLYQGCMKECGCIKRTSLFRVS
jgi:hypothetical protein